MSQRAKGTSTEEKKIMMYKFKDDKDILTYSDQGYKYISREEFKKIRARPVSGEYLLVKHNNDLNMVLAKQFKLFLETADFLKQLTDGKVNLYKTGCESKTAMQLWYDLCKPPKPDKITPEEITFIRNTRGQLKSAAPYKGKGWKLDVVSEYPSIMRSDHMSFPIKEGKFHTLTKEEFNNSKYFKYGIYRVHIQTRVDSFIFRYNEKNYYTHIDLNLAKELGYELRLIEDGKPNFLSYEGCLINGAKLFRPFVDYLYNLKQMGYKTVKIYLNSLWGKLCQKNEIPIRTDGIKEDHEAETNICQLENEKVAIFGNREILEIIPTSDSFEHDGNIKMDIANTILFYDTDYARIKPFMLAKGRYVTAKYILKSGSKPVYVNTDGFILKDKPNNDLKFGESIGDLKMEEYQDEIEVFNCNKVVGFEKHEIDPFQILEKDKKLFGILTKI